jgi:hypothetical protein
MTTIAILPFKNNETLYFFDTRIMNFAISNSTRSIVIQQYLQGKSRDDIARDCGLGTGTVSNIIAGWKANLDHYVVEDLRELGINLKKFAISPAQCARGLEFTRNDKYYASESGNDPTTAFRYPLPKGIEECSITREYHNAERYYTKPLG